MIRFVIPDTGPLISLARPDRLDLIDRFRCPILITDVVTTEPASTKETPDFPVLRDWPNRNGNQSQVVETGYGSLPERIRELIGFVPESQRARFRRRGSGRNAGESSIPEFRDRSRNGFPSDDGMPVLFEDAGVEKLFRASHVRLMSTWSFLPVLERTEVIPSAAELSDRMGQNGSPDDADADFAGSHDSS